jgi:UDP-N-acetylglucosamine kinase
MNNFDITKEEVLSIFDEMIVPQLLESITPEQVKQAFILGGQPGSGKSAFARELLQKNKNIVFINGDDLRAYHPKYHFYLKENDIEAADLTQAVCNFWIETLIQKCVEESLSLIVEGTMRKKEVPLKTSQMLHDAGYEVNLIAVSTPYELSLLSIERRYSELKRLGQPARYTKKESHDEAYQNIEGTLAELLDKSIFKKTFIYKREPGHFSGQVFGKDQKSEALQAFILGRNRELKSEEREFLPAREIGIDISLENLK